MAKIHMILQGKGGPEILPEFGRFLRIRPTV
jgi:hypothetical protein